MDNPLLIDTAIHWVAIIIYVIATIANVYGLFFNNERAERASHLILLIGLAVHGSVLLYRWQYSGHGPYMTRYEIFSANGWIVLASYLVFTRLFPRIRMSSIVVFPASFLLIALSQFCNPGIQNLPPSLRSIWLVLHVLFYKIALGTLIIAFAFSILFIVKQRKNSDWLQKLPERETLDLFAYRFTGFGFVFWAIGMLAGSIWAYQSWGRFWGWDPVEIWSLITWGLFGIYLHLRRFFAWRGDKAAYFFIICFLVSIVAIFFTPLLESSIHVEYFK